MRAVAYLDQRDEPDLSPDDFSPDEERRLVTIAASYSGFELATVYEASAGATREDALAALARGDAHALVAARACALCADRDELTALLARSAAEGWELVVLDIGLDTSRPHGRAQAEATGGQAADGPELPCLPPPDLRLRVAGLNSADHFAFSGWLHLNTYEELLRRHSLALADFRSILDFGGGPGRIARGLRMRTGASVALCDIDEPAVAWVAAHLNGVDARLSTELPPLPFESGQFDLVLCFSVFTHLDAAHQDAWLAELHRVLQPRGVVIATVHGESSWLAQPWAANRELDERFRRAGFLFRTDDWWSQYFPDYYHTAFHQPFYIRRHWSRWFDILDIVPGRDRGEHDFVLLQRRWTLRRAELRARRTAGGLKRSIRRGMRASASS